MQESLHFLAVDRRDELSAHSRALRSAPEAVKFTVLVGAEPAFNGNASARPLNSSKSIEILNLSSWNVTEKEKFLVLEFFPKQVESHIVHPNVMDRTW